MRPKAILVQAIPNGVFIHSGIAIAHRVLSDVIGSRCSGPGSCQDDVAILLSGVHSGRQDHLHSSLLPAAAMRSRSLILIK